MDQADDTDGTAGDEAAAASAREEIRRAIREVRREGYKAALVYAGADAAAASAAVALVATLAAPRASVAAPVLGELSLATAGGIATAVVVLLAEFALRAWRFSVESFERVNPEVAAALRTARDAAAAGDSREMAGALYEDVLARLRTTSSAGLVDARRVAVALVVATLLSLGTIQAAVTGVTVVGSPAGPGATPTPAGEIGGAPVPVPESTPAGDLRDPESILGEESDVEAGDEELEANVSLGPGLGDEERAERAYEASGLPSETDPVSASQAGFTDPEETENADIIKTYNVRIREADDE